MVGSLGTTLSWGNVTPGMRQRDSLRAFAKENGTLTRENAAVLDALDRLDLRLEAERKAQELAEKAAKATNAPAKNAVSTLMLGGSARDPQAAGAKARSYEAKATVLAQQAVQAESMGDTETAASLREQASQASLLAMQFRAEQSALTEKEASKRAEKAAREAEDVKEKRRAEDKLREVKEAQKRRDRQAVEKAARQGLIHVDNARKAKQNRDEAEVETLMKRVEHGQFWIRQMQLVRQGTHPAQAVAEAKLQAWQDAKSVAGCAPVPQVGRQVPSPAYGTSSGAEALTQMAASVEASLPVSAPTWGSVGLSFGSAAVVALA